MKKQIVCGLLCTGLCLSFAQAAQSGFTDVREDDWFAPYVSVCAEAGLMNGTGDGTFSPDGTVTMAEAAAIAARLGESLNDDPIVYGTAAPGETLPWYHWYVEYLKGYGVTVEQAEVAATRQQFFDLLSAVTPSSALPAINSITTLPDTQDAGVLRFYNAGILTGTDDYGTFSPNRLLKRSEVAAMMSRMVKPELRQVFVPQSLPSQQAGQSEGSFNDQAALWVNDQAVSVSSFTSWALQIAYQLDSFYYYNYNTRLSWNDLLEQSIFEQAVQYAAAQAIMTDLAQQQGCSLQELAAVLTPDPSQEILREYVQGEDILCAKHILVADESTARSVIAGLDAQPTLEQFNAILSVLGTDPGMAANPEGYLFTAGEMVEPFENGTRALTVGSYSKEPVASDFGFHVIWRLDPLDHPDLKAQYQELRLNSIVDLALAGAYIRTNDEIIANIDLPSTYNAYLQALAAQQ